MKKIKAFFKTSLIGGLLVILPVLLSAFLLRWLFNLITGLIQPITALVIEKSNIQKFLADLIVITIIIMTCFVIGSIIKTRMGNYLYRLIERHILKIAPGYSLFKETLKQFVGREKKHFSSVALVQVFENSTMVTAFVTDKHKNGTYTVFAPSGLNPTSGWIFHVKEQFVHPLDVTVEETMRSIISCGAGSSTLIQNFVKKGALS